jgi:hypothetical protein
MPKQYRVFYKRANAPKFGVLEPGIHKALYDVPPVAEAIQVLRDHPVVQALVVSHDDALFNIVAFDQEAVAAQAFILNPEPQ